MLFVLRLRTRHCGGHPQPEILVQVVHITRTPGKEASGDDWRRIACRVVVVVVGGRRTTTMEVEDGPQALRDFLYITHLIGSTRALLSCSSWFCLLEAPSSSSYRIRGLFFSGFSGNSFRKSNVYIENRLLRAPPNMELAHRIIYRFFFFFWRHEL